MAYKNKICQICHNPFKARRGDAKTCSATCRKRLQRSQRQVSLASKAARLETAIGQELQRLAASLLPRHAIYVPVVLPGKRVNLSVLDYSQEEPVAVYRPAEVIHPDVLVTSDTSLNFQVEQ